MIFGSCLPRSKTESAIGHNGIANCLLIGVVNFRTDGKNCPKLNGETFDSSGVRRLPKKDEPSPKMGPREKGNKDKDFIARNAAGYCG
jgi:hypothetical protein